MLVGAAGQIGQCLQHLSAQKGLPSSWDLLLFSRSNCDITNPADLRSAIQESKPDLVINASGLTNIDVAEKNETLAMVTNFHAVAQMAAQCSTLDIPLIHLSTDQVFDGRQTTPFREDDLMNPLNTLGGSKMMGEEAIRHELAWHVIIRTSCVFSALQSNILTETMDLIEKHEELRIVTDIVSAPTYGLDIARAIVVIGQALLNGKTDGFGTVHLTGTPAASRYDFVEAVLKAYAPQPCPNLVPTVCAEFPDFVRHPAYSVLNCEKIKRVYGIDQAPWQTGLEEAIKMLKNTESPLQI